MHSNLSHGIQVVRVTARCISLHVASSSLTAGKLLITASVNSAHTQLHHYHVMTWASHAHESLEKKEW